MGAKLGRGERGDMTACFGSSIRLYWLNMLTYLWLNLIEIELCAHAFPRCTTYSRRSLLWSYLLQPHGH